MAKPRIRKEARPGFSRGMALYYLNDLEQQFERICCVSLAAMAYEEGMHEDARNVVLANLFETIKGQTDDSVIVRSKLRKMLEALPKEARHG